MTPSYHPCNMGGVTVNTLQSKGVSFSPALNLIDLKVNQEMKDMERSFKALKMANTYRSQQLRKQSLYLFKSNWGFCSN